MAAVKTHPMRARIRNEADGTARVDVYDDIGGGGFWGGGLSAADFAGQLSGVKGALAVHINSGGGDVFDGLAIAEAIRGHQGPVTTVVDGIAASIASVIAQAGAKRVMAPGSMMMVHDAWGMCDGNQAEMAAMADRLGKVSDNLAAVYADRAGGTQQQWRQKMQAETWMTADEAVTAGLADEVGGSAARVPAGTDVTGLAARAPARIAARLRTIAAAASPEDGDGGTACKTCDGKGRLPHPGTGKNGMKCPGCGGTGTYDPDTAPPDDPDDEPGAQDRLKAQAGRPYEPQPYKRTSDENVQCPACGKYSDDDARHCGQCGAQLTGRTDVKEAALSPASNGLDPEAVRALVREELIAAVLIPGPDGYFRAAVDGSDWDASKAWAAGAASDDPAAFYRGICAGEKSDGDPSTQAHWALPYKYAPGDPPNAAAVKAALGRLSQTEGLANKAEAEKTLQAAMKQVNPDWEPEDRSEKSIFSLRLEQMRGAMPPLEGAQA
jgi:ATP-dependent Clp endopeptidase proteolytic subunit ClpP